MYNRIMVLLRKELSVLNLNLNGMMTIERSWSADRISKEISGSFNPKREENSPNNNCDKSENQKIENKILFIIPFHSILLNKMNPQTILINGNISTIIIPYKLLLI